MAKRIQGLYQTGRSSRSSPGKLWQLSLSTPTHSSWKLTKAKTQLVNKVYLYNENSVKILPLTSTAILTYSFKSPGYGTHYDLNCKCFQLNPRLETRTRRRTKQCAYSYILTLSADSLDRCVMWNPYCGKSYTSLRQDHEWSTSLNYKTDIKLQVFYVIHTAYILI